jgi:hypothetical protein
VAAGDVCTHTVSTSFHAFDISIFLDLNSQTIPDKKPKLTIA